MTTQKDAWHQNADSRSSLSATYTYVLCVYKFVSINEFHSPIMSDFAHYLGHVVLNICGKLCNHGYTVLGQ
jgi:Zn-dependent peptidase ImmA (M78 family)